MNVPILMVPGIHNSGPEHWQSIWERMHPHCHRVRQRDWDHPICLEWVAALGAAVKECRSPPLLVAHSLGCLVTVQWAGQSLQPIKGALLVAVPDPEGPQFPQEARGFCPIPPARLPFPSIVVASTDDIYSPLDYSKRCAAGWDSELVVIGAAGHINAASGLGEWKYGWTLVQKLLKAKHGESRS